MIEQESIFLWIGAQKEKQLSEIFVTKCINQNLTETTSNFICTKEVSYFHGAFMNLEIFPFNALQIF
jgi:hypothetical protein